jgi:hypothetical protein
MRSKCRAISRSRPCLRKSSSACCNALSWVEWVTLVVSTSMVQTTINLSTILCFLGHLVLRVAVYRLPCAATELKHIPENRIILRDQEAFCALGTMLRYPEVQCAVCRGTEVVHTNSSALQMTGCQSSELPGPFIAMGLLFGSLRYLVTG